ncbi:histidine phosphatase family protein [Metabacillus sp. RGM 3146]|uniref:histidine phosphatase family protein n=1 Tax=Metabacillus sp. RGM 3146 TaxID=3401092 RepID=UPI003B9C0FF4
MADTVAVALFRHGLTERNKQHAYSGWGDISLSKEGIDALKSTSLFEPDLLFSSDLKRCEETAAILFPGYHLTFIPEFREMNFGDWEGRTYEELKEDLTYLKWLDDPAAAKPPNGESMVEFSLRVKHAWSLIKKAVLPENQRIVIITHGGPIRQLLSMLSIEKKAFWEWELPPASGYELIFDRETFGRNETCTSLQVEPITAKANG